MAKELQLKFFQYQLGLKVYRDEVIEEYFTLMASRFELDPLEGIIIACKAKSMTPFWRMMERFPFFCQFTYLGTFFRERTHDRMLDYVLENIEGWEADPQKFEAVKNFSWKYNYVKGQRYCGDFVVPSHAGGIYGFCHYFEDFFSVKHWSIEERYRLLDNFSAAFGFSREEMYTTLVSFLDYNNSKNYGKLLKLFPDKTEELIHDCFLLGDDECYSEINFKGMKFPRDQLLWLTSLQSDSRLLMERFKPESFTDLGAACLEIMRGEDLDTYKAITIHDCTDHEDDEEYEKYSLGLPVRAFEMFMFAAIHYRNVPVLRWMREYFTTNPTHEIFLYFAVNHFTQECPVSIEFVEEIKLFCEQCKPYFSSSFHFNEEFGELFFLTGDWDYFVAHREYELIPATFSWLGSIEMIRRAVEVYDAFKWEDFLEHRGSNFSPWKKQHEALLLKFLTRQLEIRPHFERETICELAIKALEHEFFTIHEWLCALLDG